MICFTGFSSFLHKWRSFARPQVKTLIVKFRLLSRKTPISLMFFSLIGIVSNTDYLDFGDLIKVVRTTLPPSIPRLLFYFRGWNGNFECDFYKNMKDTFNEFLSNITNYVVLHPFLRTQHSSLSFIRQLILIIAFPLKYSSNNSILVGYIANYSIIFYCSNFEHGLCVIYNVFCFSVLYPTHML